MDYTRTFTLVTQLQYRRTINTVDSIFVLSACRSCIYILNDYVNKLCGYNITVNCIHTYCMIVCQQNLM